MKKIKMKDLVSICVPIYGVEKYIERCARSLFEQTYDNIEYVFVNDCTKDRSIDILNKVIEDYPQRKNKIQIINHDKNKGLAGARNTGVQVASGDWILWVDSDDYIDTTTVDKLICAQKINNADIVCFDGVAIFAHSKTYYKNLEYIDGKDLALKMLQNKAPHQVWGHLIRKTLYTENNIRAIEGINQGEDFHVMPQIAYYAKKVRTFHQTLYYYDRTSEDSYSNNFTIKSLTQIEEAQKIIENFFIDKEPYFVETLRNRKSQDIAFLMKYASLCEDDSYYDHLIEQRDKLPRKFKCINQIQYKIIMFLKYKTLVGFFVQNSLMIKKILHI